MSSMYEQSGVNIEEGYRAVARMKEVTQKTMIDGVLSGLGSFGSLFQISKFGQFKDPVLVAGTDGVGTKLKIAYALGVYDTVGIDAVAMCANDVLCQGAQPIFFLDYLACGKLEADKAAQLVTGVAEGCLQAGCALVGGETAEMPGFYKEGDYDIAGFCVGIVERDRLIDGSAVQDGDVLIGLDSSGLHSNGFSLVNRLAGDIHAPFEAVYRGEIEPRYRGKTLGEVLLTPTKIYVKPVMEANLRFNLHGIANITGGGFIENIPRMFSKDQTAVIDKNKLNVTAPFRYMMELGVPEMEMYNTFNMGTSMVIAVDRHEADAVLDFFNAYDGDFPARVVGEVVAGLGEPICIK